MTFLPKLAVTALAALVLTSCGSSSDDSKAKDDSSTGSSGSPSASSSPSPSDTNTAQPAAGQAIRGTGYSYHLPKSWENITAQLKKSQPKIDTGGRQKPATPPFTANLNTLTTPSQFKSDPTADQLDSLGAQVRREVLSLAPQIKTLDPTVVDGAPTVHQEGAANSGGQKFFLVQYFAVHGGNNYGITFAFPPKASQAQRDKVVLPVLKSWSWS